MLRFEQITQAAGTGATQVKIPLRGHTRLRSIEALETTSTGTQVYDLASIGLLYPSNGLSISLKAGHIGRQNTLIWLGDIIVPEQIQILVTFFYPATGGKLYVRYSYCDIDDSANGGASPLETVQAFPLGVLRLIGPTGGGAASAGPVTFRPDAGRQWDIIRAWAYHDDVTTGTLDLYWSIYDGTTQLNSEVLTITANTEHFPLGYFANPTYHSPGLRATRDVYYQLRSTAAPAAGKQLVIAGLVMEYGFLS